LLVHIAAIMLSCKEAATDNFMHSFTHIASKTTAFLLVYFQVA